MTFRKGRGLGILWWRPNRGVHIISRKCAVKLQTSSKRCDALASRGIQWAWVRCDRWGGMSSNRKVESLVIAHMSRVLRLDPRNFGITPAGCGKLHTDLISTTPQWWGICIQDVLTWSYWPDHITEANARFRTVGLLAFSLSRIQHWIVVRKHAKVTMWETDETVIWGLNSLSVSRHSWRTSSGKVDWTCDCQDTVYWCDDVMCKWMGITLPDVGFSLY